MTASQCVGLGFAANLAMVVTAKAMSGQVVRAAQFRALTVSQYGMSHMIACSAALSGACLLVSQMEVSIGVDRDLRSAKL